MTNPTHAIVVGGSLAGLFAARVLADHYDQVAVLDRDQLPPAPASRAGVPQAHHAHGLLARGRQLIDAFFPGLMAELRADGAEEGDFDRLAVVTPAGPLRQTAIGAQGTFVSRLRLEWAVRQRLLADPRVRIQTGGEVTGLLASPDRTRVIGVTLRPRGTAGEPAELCADMVVDASGRHSAAPRWLAELGYAAPPEETITSGVGYLSRLYARPAAFPAPWDAIIVNARPPHNPRAGLILPIEGDRWHVTLGTYAGHYPPPEASTDEGFLAFAAQLPDPSIAAALRLATPLTPVRAFRTPTNRLRHFEQLKRWPAGLVVTGDAVCAFNPIYGQGMTTSALGAATLAAVLRARPRQWEQVFQRRLARVVAAPWFIATSEDLRWPGVTLSGGPHRVGSVVLRAYVNALLAAGRTDQEVSRAYLRMLNMLDRPGALLRPGVAVRVAGQALARRLGVAAKAPTTALPPALLAELGAQ